MLAKMPESDVCYDISITRARIISYLKYSDIEGKESCPLFQIAQSHIYDFIDIEGIAHLSISTPYFLHAGPHEAVINDVMRVFPR